MLVQTLTKISRFTGDAAGLEKTLRFLQSIAQVTAASVSAAPAKPWLQAQGQCALGRRYLRFFKFVDAFSLAFQSMNSFGLKGLLETGKWSCLGMFLLLECCTIMDDMGIWSTDWAPRSFVEAMKFWFYSLSCSVLLGLLLIYESLSESTGSIKKTDKEREVDKRTEPQGSKTRALSRKLFMKLVEDSCDLFIPGAITGWLEVSSFAVGILGIISTVLASFEIWERVQRSEQSEF